MIKVFFYFNVQYSIATLEKGNLFLHTDILFCNLAQFTY